jgi:2-dehydro-3-deoxyphosphooctonate aldolase (KDO 8-P synthase)
VDGFFFEVHEDPAKALSDGPNALRLDQFGALLDQLLVLWRASRAATLDDPVSAT